MKEKENLSEEEYLRRHLSDIERGGQHTTDLPKVKVIDDTTTTNLKYFAFDVKEFPCGIFYPQGTTIQIRPAEVSEIQSYSMVDDTNYYDIVEKMNEMISSCVRIKYPDGNITSYLNVCDADRFYLIFSIRELTFQQGNSLVTKAVCECGIENQLELKRSNFKSYQPPKMLDKYYDEVNRCYRFETKSGSVFNLAPPSIGLQRAFTDYIVSENALKKKPNMSFLKIVPFMLHDRTSITQEGIKSKLSEFSQMTNDSFQFVNSAVEKITFGIEEVIGLCSCGLEVRSEMIFPNGPSALFINDDAFESFIKE